MRSHLPYELLTGLLDDLWSQFGQQMGLAWKTAAVLGGISLGAVWVSAKEQLKDGSSCGFIYFV